MGTAKAAIAARPPGTELAAASGAWGVATGFLVFPVLAHESHHPIVLVVGLALAVAAAAFIEHLRGAIQGHDAAASSRPPALVALLTLALAEFFVAAIHGVAGLSSESVAALSSLILGDFSQDRTARLAAVTGLAAIWIGTGAALAAALVAPAPPPRGDLRRATLRGAGRGALVGLVGAPFVLLALVVVVRVVRYVMLWIGGARLQPLVNARLAEPGSVAALLGLTALAWVVPTTVLGALAPSLDRPGEHPRLWGVLGLVGALVIVVTTLLGETSAWFLLPAAALAATVVFVRRGSPVATTWPLLALAAATVVTAGSWIRQAATFPGVYENFFDALAAKLPEKPAVRIPSGNPALDVPPGWLPGVASGYSLATLPSSLRAAKPTVERHRPVWHDDEEVERLAADATPDERRRLDAWRRANDPQVARS